MKQVIVCEAAWDKTSEKQKEEFNNAKIKVKYFNVDYDRDKRVNVYYIKKLPTTLVFNENNKLLNKFEGFITAEELLKVID